MELLDELRGLICRYAVGYRHEHSRELLPGVRVSRRDARTELEAGISEPSVAIVASGLKRTLLNGVPYEYGAGQYLVTSLDLPVIGQAAKATREEPFTVVSLRLDPAEIASLLLELPARPAQYGGLVVSDADDELLDPVVRLLRIADRPDDVRVLAAGIRREILWRLLTGEQGSLVRQIGLADGMLAHIAEAIRWIRRNPSAQLRVADLAELAGMSPSTFHRHFRAATSMTPIQFQKQLRLQQARIQLRTRATPAATIAHEVGYASPSQFTHDYQKAFGKTPGEDRTP
ncbi:AraC family transcriptional regulator [Kribbella jejuensis]|uniref:AraC family transcriptional regulator n=1 Tax=Kribbella jejuensis TaxID=236068 RepID=A0A542ENB1_9ACTN|nr:AraC family transcriptional regulator [Kribbella jejuensis]TQJ16823.1 AraC family transcriptional regulator [Kribbella jejuensis]